MTRVAVTGANGQVGSALCRRLGERAIAVDRGMLDLTDISSIRPMIQTLGPDVVVNAAAYTAVDRAEAEPDLAHAVNANAVGELAAASSDIGARFVTFSTDYVFDGTKDGPYVEGDATNPINTYGASKRAGEIRALEALPSALVIRTSWVMSGTHRSFASVILERIRSDGARVVADQHGYPTFADDLAAATLDAVDRKADGLLHLTNAGAATWYDIARHIASMADIDPSRVQPCATTEYPTPAARPANSMLNSERRALLGVAPLRHYTEPLRESVHQLLALEGSKD